MIATLNVQPFGVFVLKSGFSDANGGIASKARKIVLPTPDGGTKTFDIPAQAGNPNPFTTKLMQQKKYVPCCQPQRFTLELDVTAQRKHLFGIVSAINGFQFAIQAVDPPEQIEGTVVMLDVETIVLPAAPMPKAAPGVMVKCILPEGPETISGMAEANGKLLLVRQNGTPANGEVIVSDLVELDIGAGDCKVVMRDPHRGMLGFVSRLKRIQLPGMDGLQLVAVELGTPDLMSGVPLSGDGRVVRIAEDGGTEVIADNLDLPTDVTPLEFNNETFMVVSTAGDGNLYKWDGGDEFRHFVSHLTTPVGVDSPPTGSTFDGELYTAEFGNIGDDTDFDGTSGRIVEFDLHTQTAKTFATGISPKAMAFSPGGQFGTDLIVAVANAVEPGSGQPISNSGQILRYASNGAMTPLATNIDDPVDITFSPEGRCFVLAASGIFELSANAAIPGQPAEVLRT